jgi:heme exporter protein A
VADAIFTGTIDEDVRKFGVFCLSRGARRQAGIGLMQLKGENLTCNRGGREVFAGVSFTLGAGQALLVTGRNGAGKSSLLRLIAGLVPMAAGRIELTGGEADVPIAERAHYLGHQDALKPSLSVAENLQFWSDYFGGGIAVEAALEGVGLEPLANLPAAYLSAGQRRRLSIARLIAVARPLWLLDEPTSALDSVSQMRLADLMAGHLAGGGLIVAAAHGPIGLAQTQELKLGPT